MSRLDEIRVEIDRIDRELTALFVQRMEAVKEVAAYKKENGKPILDPERERMLFDKVAALAGEEMEAYTRTLYAVITDLSRSYQSKLLYGRGEIAAKIQQSVAETPQMLPAAASVACQGVEGAYSQLACSKLFENPSIFYFNSFENVFSAVESGLCRYGILPVENSTAGSVNAIYDLMAKHDFYIVRSLKLKTSHTLLAKRGAKFENIQEIISHEQAINQCSAFLKTLPNVKITLYPNTALAAKAVFESDRDDLAAISSKNCAELYGLQVLDNRIQNTDSNYTRFICISRENEIFPGANKTSMMMTLPHKPGSLYHVMSRFSAAGVNLTKLESRPIPGSDFEFLFYLDAEGSVYSPSLLTLMDELEHSTDSFRYLGSYLELT